MATHRKPFVIALEEHYWDAEVAKSFEGAEARRPAPLRRGPALRQRLDDLGARHAPGARAKGLAGTHAAAHGEIRKERILAGGSLTDRVIPAEY
jgi:hypothetical protein